MRFDTTQFQFSHGKAPRGVGRWTFSTDRDCSRFLIPVPGLLTYSDAKRQAARIAIDRANRSAYGPNSTPYCLYVCP